MGMLKNIAIFVALVAAGLMYKPEVVLHLPMGFIPYAILGHPPPPYFMYDAWKPSEIDTWTRDGDLIVAAGAKSGTNWLLYMSHLIRVKGDVQTYPFEDVLYSTPWMSLRHQPGQSWAELKEKMNSTILSDGKTKLKDRWDHANYPFRIFKSHEVPVGSADVPAAVLPVRTNRNLKFLACVRNPLDQLRSVYPFWANHHPHFRKMWGGFPPVYASKDGLMADFLDGGILSSLVWDYAKTWFSYKDDPNVLLFVFENILKEPKVHVKKLAEFLEVALTPEELDTIVHLTSFAEMKKIESAFDYKLWGHHTKPEMTIMQSGTLLRAGKKGQGKDFFNEAEKVRIQAHVDEHFSPEIQEFMGLA